MTTKRNALIGLEKNVARLVKRVAWSTLSIVVTLSLSATSAEELNAAPAGGIVLVVTNTEDSGSGSLREAITLANLGTLPVTIEFDIPGAGPHVIQPDTLLPALSVPTLVDGLSQDGADCTTWPPTLRIEISGANLTHFDAYGLALDSGSEGSEIRGLVVRDVDFNTNSDGLHISSDDNRILCNFIGTDVTGTAAAGNTTGIELRNASSNVIGTEAAGSAQHERNLISGNANIGIRIGRGTNNRISGNWIGTDVTGTGALSGGAGLGISILSGNTGPVENTVIGYDGAGDPELMRNVISGNRIGISLGGHTRRTHVAGNYIGLNAQGTAAVANSDMGVSSAGGHPDLPRLYNLIGWDGTPGQRAAQRNVISGNGQGGVFINYFNNMGNEGAVIGNWIGTDAQEGDTAVPNGVYGLNLQGGVDPTRELVHGNRIENNPVGIRLEGGSSSTQHPSFWNGVDTPELPNLSSTDNCIAGNGAGVARAGAGTTVAVTFIENWWGAGDGPGGSGGGAGDSVPGELDYQPFLTESPAHCVGTTYTLEYLAGPGGSITGDTPQTVEHGSDGTPVTAVPDTGYHFVQWSDGNTDNPRTDTGVTADLSVTAEFAINQYTLEYLPGPNGSITGDTPQTVDHGADGTPVTAVPDTGYHFVQWSDGNTDNPRTDNGVTADLSVTAEFAINQYTLEYLPGPNGSIAGDTPQTVDHGADGTPVTAVPDTGYHFVQWSDGNTDNPRTDTGVTADLSVTAEFAINQYTVTATASGNGAVAPATQTVEHGGAAALTVTPDAGHSPQFGGDCPAGALVGDDYTTGPITADCEVAVTFTQNPPAVLEIVGGNDQSTPVGTAFDIPLAVHVADGEGTPLPGVPVTFEVHGNADGAGASLSAITVETGDLGIAETLAVANDIAGNYTVSASVVGVEPVTFALRNIGPVPAIPTLTRPALLAMALLLLGLGTWVLGRR